MKKTHKKIYGWPQLSRLTSKTDKNEFTGAQSGSFIIVAIEKPTSTPTISPL